MSEQGDLPPSRSKKVGYFYIATTTTTAMADGSDRYDPPLSAHSLYLKDLIHDADVN